ncbi:MAG: hypothetical protein JNK04_13320 [Myxococcales bacterium]|nr:hypothetical protein [Myxococcales bacterium]
MKKTIGLFGLMAFALASSAVGCGDSGTGGSGGGASGGGDEGGGPASGGGGGGAALVNGCDQATAENQTTAAEVDIDWKLSTQECIRVAVGTTVNWNVTAPSTFASHPLVGGTPGGGEEPGLITDSDQTGATASVTFTEAGEYPFFCNIHLQSMQGVIYVE